MGLSSLARRTEPSPLPRALPEGAPATRRTVAYVPYASFLTRRLAAYSICRKDFTLSCAIELLSHPTTFGDKVGVALAFRTDCTAVADRPRSASPRSGTVVSLLGNESPGTVVRYKRE